MKTDEFIKKVQRLRFRTDIKLDNNGKIFCITIGDGKENFVRIWSFPYAISTFDDQFMFCKGDLPLIELYKLCFEYSATPINDRK